MNSDIKIYNIKSFVRKNVSGGLDLEKSLELARNLANIASLHANHNILVDMRDTTVANVKINELTQIALEIANNIPDFQNKIVSVIPDNQKRLHTAKQFQSCMTLEGFNFKIFTDFEKALEWLADTSDVHFK